MFQSRDVGHQRNVFKINGVYVFGGLPASLARDAWNGNILLLDPRHQLRATGNVLHFESRNSSGGGGCFGCKTGRSMNGMPNVAYGSITASQCRI